MAKTEKFFSTIMCAAIASVLASAAGSAYAADATDANKSSVAAAGATPASSAPASTTGSTPGAAVNTGSVATTVANFKTEEQQLRRMAEAIKRVRRGGFDVIGECMQPIEMIGEIDIIGQDIIPIMPQTAEGFGNQYQPPRPKYINMHVAALGLVVPLLQDEVNTLVVPDSEKVSAAGPLEDLKGNLGDIVTHYNTLQKMVANNDYNQFNLTNEARGLDSAAKAMEIARKKLLHEEGVLEKKEEKIEKK